MGIAQNSSPTFDQLLAVYGSKILAYVIGILAVSAVGCYFGYKLSKIYTAICNFLFGVLTGIVLVAITGNLLFYNPVGFLIGFALAALSVKFEKFGIFLTTFSISGIFFGDIAYFLKNGATQAEIPELTFADIKPFLIIGAVCGLITAIFSLKFPKPIMIVCTTVGFGTLAGSMLAVLMDNPKLEIPLWIALAVSGLIVQIKMNGGLSEDPQGRPMSKNYDPQEYVNPYAMPGQPNPQFGSKSTPNDQSNDFFGKYQ